MRPIRSGPLARSRARITQQMSTLRGRLTRTEYAATTGLANERLSDAPSIWTAVHRLGEQLDDQKTWESNAKKAVEILGAADQALGEGARIMREARAVAVRMSTESMSADDRKQAAGAVRGMFDGLLKEANTNSAGRYIFAGTAYDQRPFDATGTYGGTSDIPGTLLSASDEVTLGSDGSTTFEPALAALEALATALDSGDASAVQATLASIDQSLDALIAERVDLGAQHRVALDTLELTATMRVNLQSALDDRLAADPFATFQTLNELRTTYEATTAVTASSYQLRGLMDRL